MLITIILSTTSVVSFSQNAADDSADTILDEELENLDRLTNDKSLLIDEYFGQILSEFSLLEKFTDNLFNERLNVSELPSYYSIPSIDPTVSVILEHDDVNDREVSFKVSGWYVPEISSIDQVSDEVMNLVDISSNLDMAFRTLYQANSAYSNLYLGFEEDGLFRIYPYQDKTGYLTFEYPDARNNQTKVGYDPRARPWYVSALETTSISFSEPYTDASGLGLLVTVTVPIHFDNGTLIGILGADLTITSIQTAILGAEVLENGYAYMLDSDGNAIIHKSIDRDLPAQSIVSLEFTSNNQNEITSFSSDLLNQMKSGNVGNGQFKKNRDLWYISYAPIPSTQFALALVVPESDILAPANKIKDDILDALFSQLVVFFIILLIISGVIFYFTNYTSGQIVKPIQELTEITNLIASGNLSRDLKGGVSGSREITMLYNTFRGLVTALRFGNDDYYAGNINRAMDNYIAALELFTSLNNLKGIGICHNNLGNIHRARGNLKDANSEYRRAIDIAQELYEKSPPDKKPEHVFAIASRMNNLALLYLSIEEYDRAEEMLNQALNYDREIDNARGFATRYGNLGLVYLAQNRTKEAKDSFDEAREIAIAHDSERAIAYATMNHGVYERAMGNIDQAIEHFLKAVELSADLDIRVSTTSLKNLQEIYEERGQIDLASQIEDQIKKLGGAARSKEVTLVLDYSGSMSGKRITAAVNGIRNIFKDQVNSQDLVSLILFDTQSRVLIPPVTKEDNEKRFMQTFAKLNRPTGGTAFYDALNQAFADFISRPTPNEQWIIALTDGDDNSSYSDVNNVSRQAKSSIGVNLVIIGVGRLAEQKTLEKICKSTDKGQFIDVRDGVTDAITTAFEEVSSMLSEVEVEGFTSDY
ncbi:MAG: tetratricopeptide repeat protein [Candidatus Kariarchaeaceae archaeon]|jgi:tetratricopeptide (TPR) repeat protein